MTSEQITGIVRAIMAAIGGFFIGKGTVTPEMWTWISGSALTLIPAVWTIWQNRPAGLAASAQKLQGVTVDARNATPEVQAAVQAVKNS